MLVWQVVHHARKFSALGRNLRRSRRASELKVVDRPNDILQDAEALWRDLNGLELKLTPAGVDPEGFQLLEASTPLEIDQWLEEEEAHQKRLEDLRGLQQEMFEQARKAAADLTPDACLLEGLNMAEILRLPKGSKKLVRKATTKNL
ncbi:unnamed protein product [Effrenium voratum]|uniref:Uncharacterized protein n=1 Tax=Effrenium voratum TaxID=2562239 RepID=A0AA36MKZ8_9DINO|nr:unnamed protein product [Effrenium voratum]